MAIGEGEASRIRGEAPGEFPLLTPTLSSPPGRRGRTGGAIYVPSPPFRGERDRERWVVAGSHHVK